MSSLLRHFLAAAALAILIAVAGNTFADRQPAFPELPEFTHSAVDDWINSTPLSKTDLAGKVVLVDVWTFACWNCYRSFPWLNELNESLANEDFVTIGVHSPEFDHEKERESVVKKVREFGLTHPIMLDNDLSYWKALGNRYWPAFYLIDKHGKARGYWVGETHSGDKRALQIEQAVRTLLAED